MRRRYGGRSGQAMVMMSLAMVVLCGMMAVGVDVGLATSKQHMLRNAADNAATAARQLLDNHISAITVTDDLVTNAITASLANDGLSVWNVNGAAAPADPCAAGISGNQVALTAVYVNDQSVPVTDTAGNPITVTNIVTNAPLDAVGVQVNLGACQPAMFGRVIGHQNYPIEVNPIEGQPAQGATNTPSPTNTPTNTGTPGPSSTATATDVPLPTNTSAPVSGPTNTSVPVSGPTNTPVPALTNTSVPVPTNTSPPVTLPTNTPVPAPTNTSVPVSGPTNTPVTLPTNTPVPAPTNTSVPVSGPTNTPVPVSVPTNTPVPAPTNTSVPAPTNTPVPLPTPTTCNSAGSASATFTNYQIGNHDNIWFSSVIQVTGLAGISHPVTIHFNSTSLNSPFSNGTFLPSVANANGTVTFDPNLGAHAASTTFDSANNMWNTTVPMGVSGNVFIAGMLFHSGTSYSSVGSVTWNGTITVDTPGVTVQWKWAAAHYLSWVGWSSTPNDHIKPVDDLSASGTNALYNNADRAGTPEDDKGALSPGGTGAGGTDYTGQYSPAVTLACASTSSAPTNTSVPVATNTSVPVATNTSVPVATNTSVPQPTNTPVPVPTNTSVPRATNTSVPVPTNTPVPVATNTSVPLSTHTAVPVATNTPVPVATNTPVPLPTNTPVPLPTNTPVPLPTSTALPTATATAAKYPYSVSAAPDNKCSSTSQKIAPEREAVGDPYADPTGTPDAQFQAQEYYCAGVYNVGDYVTVYANGKGQGNNYGHDANFKGYIGDTDFYQYYSSTAVANTPQFTALFDDEIKQPQPAGHGNNSPGSCSLRMQMPVISRIAHQGSGDWFIPLAVFIVSVDPNDLTTSCGNPTIAKITGYLYDPHDILTGHSGRPFGP